MEKINKRIEYIDALRGFTMILVVFSHVEVLGIAMPSTVLGQVFQHFRMPLFFFISGYISQKRSNINNAQEWFSSVTKKVKIQLLPTLFFGIIFTYCYLHRDIYELLLHKSKYGYWFTICLLWMFVILYTLTLLTKKCSNRKKVLTLVATSMFLYALKTIFNNYETLRTLGDILCLHQLLMYFHFFSAGYIAAMYKEHFNRCLNNQFIIMFAIAVFIVLSYVAINFDDAEWSSGLMRIYRLMSFPLLGYAGIIIVYNYFRVYEDSFSTSKPLGRILQYIGKRTLDIYMLHYFFLPQLPQLELIFSNPQNSVLELSVCIILSLMIVGICLIVSNVLRTSPIIARNLFGAK